MKGARRTISAAEFKTNCLALLDEVGRSRETLIVTKRGRPVAQVVALDDDTERRPMLGSVRCIGDIVVPIDDSWEASR